jgi:hypothetical protein
MLEQAVIVALLVAGCTVYAAWRLMPSAGRRAIARHLLRLPLPSGFEATLQKQLVADSGCACDGCDQATVKKAPVDLAAGQPIRFHPRVKR